MRILLVVHPSSSPPHGPIVAPSLVGPPRKGPVGGPAAALRARPLVAYRSNYSSHPRSSQRRSIARVPLVAPARQSDRGSLVPRLDPPNPAPRTAPSFSSRLHGLVLVHPCSSTRVTRSRSHRYHPRGRQGGESAVHSLPPGSTLRSQPLRRPASAAPRRRRVGYRERHQIPSPPPSTLAHHSPGLGPGAGWARCSGLRGAAAASARRSHSACPPPSHRHSSAPPARCRTAPKLRGRPSRTPTALAQQPPAPCTLALRRPQVAAARRRGGPLGAAQPPTSRSSPERGARAPLRIRCVRAYPHPLPSDPRPGATVSSRQAGTALQRRRQSKTLEISQSLRRRFQH